MEVSPCPFLFLATHRMIYGQKNLCIATGYSGYGGELSEHLNKVNISFAPVRALRTGAFLLFFSNSALSCLAYTTRVRRGFAKGEPKTCPQVRKRVRTWNLIAPNGKDAALSMAFAKEY